MDQYTDRTPDSATPRRVPVTPGRVPVTPAVGTPTFNTPDRGLALKGELLFAIEMIFYVLLAMQQTCFDQFFYLPWYDLYVINEPDNNALIFYFVQ